jgi:hypothetical protein
VAGALKKLLGRCPCGGGVLGWGWCLKMWALQPGNLAQQTVVWLEEKQMCFT